MVEWEEAARWRNVKSFQLSGEFNLKNRCCQLCFVVLDTNLLPWCCSKWFWIKLECAGMHLTAKLRHFCVILAFVSIFLYSHIHAHLCRRKSFTCKQKEIVLFTSYFCLVMSVLADDWYSVPLPFYLPSAAFSSCQVLFAWSCIVDTWRDEAHRLWL